MMVLALLLAALPSADEVHSTVRARFEAVGRAAPVPEPALDRAALELARRALRTSVTEAVALASVTGAVSRAGGWDPNPTALLIRARPEELLPTLSSNRDLAGQPATLMGAAVVSDEEEGALCVLLAQRRVELRPIARAHPRIPKPQHLCVRLLPPRVAADLYVTRPSGLVDAIVMQATGEERCAMIAFGSRGRHTVEVLVQGAGGPEIGALFFVDVGLQPSQPDDERLGRDPPTAAETRALLLSRINALRTAMGVAALTADSALDAVAQTYSDRLAAEGFLAHIAPDGSDLRSRLTEARYPFAAAGENLGAASSALMAHWGIEHSPGHRRNLLEPAHARLGIGLSRRADQQAVVVEILASPVPVVDDPLAAMYAAVERARAARQLSPLRRSAALEAIAQRHAMEMLKRNEPASRLAGRPDPHQQAFQAVDGLASVSVDVSVSQSPHQIVESKNLAKVENTVVGVGLAHGDSPTYGSGRYWVVVIYGAVK